MAVIVNILLISRFIRSWLNLKGCSLLGGKRDSCYRDSAPY